MGEVDEWGQIAFLEKEEGMEEEGGKLEGGGGKLEEGYNGEGGGKVRRRRQRDESH